MVTISQQTLPLTAPTRNPSRRPAASTKRAPLAAVQQTVRWGAAVVEPRIGREASNWQEVSSKSRRGRRTTVWVDEALPKVASRPQPARPRVIRELAPAPKADLSAGDSFARNRIRHAFELFGACMMIITFLAFAMFA